MPRCPNIGPIGGVALACPAFIVILNISLYFLMLN